MLLNYRTAPTPAVNRHDAWLSRAFGWLAGPPRWRDRDKGRSAIAAVSDDGVGDLSEAGRRIRQEIRRQHARRLRNPQYKENAMATLVATNVAIRPRVRSLKFMQAIITIIKAFQEALEMRNAAHRHRPFIDE